MSEKIFTTLWMIIIVVALVTVAFRVSSCQEHNDKYRYNGRAIDKAKTTKR